MKLSYALIAVIGLAEAGKRKPNRAQSTTTSTSTTQTTTTSTTSATDTTPVVGAAGTFPADIDGQWNVSSGADAGNNVNVMLNAGDPVTTATIVTTNNAGDLVLAVAQATLDDVANTITINGNVGTLGADGSVTFTDGTVWGAGAATVTTTLAPGATAAATTLAPAATTLVDAGGDTGSDPYGSSSGGSSDTYSGGSSGGSSDTYSGGSTDTAADPYSGGSMDTSDPVAADPYSGGSMDTADSTYNPSGTGYISGDPHVMVQTPGQKPICYDVHGDSLDFVSLLFDVNTGLEINGQLAHVKEHKSRLSAIGFKTPAEVEIGVFPDRVTVGYKGQIEEQYDFADYMRVTTDDATIEILSKNDAKHQGVMIEMNDGSLFHIEDKDFKESMKLEIIRSDGMSGRLSGVLGQTIQPKDYVINPDGSIMVEDRYIPQSTWDTKNNCFRIRDFDVRDFLGHSVYDYAVPGIFSTMNQAWLQVQLASELPEDPK